MNNIEPEEFIDPRNTVYRYDQILTKGDIIQFIHLLEIQFQATDSFYNEERAHLLTAIKTADTLLNWIVAGKQRDFGGLI